MSWRISIITAFAAAVLVVTPAYALMQTEDLAWSSTISTASSFPGDDPIDELVWVCKLVGPPGNPQLQPGENPIQVSASATTDGKFNDAHGSPVVPAGTDCDDVWPPAASRDSEGEEDKEESESKHHGDLVSICKLVGPPGSPQLQTGENPIQVPANATSGGKFNDAHGSPVVAPGTNCADILPPAEKSEVENSEDSETGKSETEQDTAMSQGRDDAGDDEHNVDETSAGHDEKETEGEGEPGGGSEENAENNANGSDS